MPAPSSSRPVVPSFAPMGGVDVGFSISDAPAQPPMQLPPGIASAQKQQQQAPRSMPPGIATPSASMPSMAPVVPLSQQSPAHAPMAPALQQQQQQLLQQQQQQPQ